MNITTHENERIRDLQRQLHDAGQFRQLVREMRSVQRRERRQIFDCYSPPWTANSACWIQSNRPEVERAHGSE